MPWMSLSKSLDGLIGSGEEKTKQKTKQTKQKKPIFQQSTLKIVQTQGKNVLKLFSIKKMIFKDPC